MATMTATVSVLATPSLYHASMFILISVISVDNVIVRWRQADMSRRRSRPRNALVSSVSLPWIIWPLVVRTATFFPAFAAQTLHTQHKPSLQSLSNPAHRQDYTVACLNYTLQTMMPLPGWPVMAPNAYHNNNNNCSHQWHCSFFSLYKCNTQAYF